jgi:MtN3 and saliva related transmembrane protein
MSRMPIDVVGYVAAVLTTIAFVPQALTSWRTRDLSGVSLPMYSIFTAGVAMWLAYGVMLGSSLLPMRSRWRCRARCWL